jgi:hypothetical protein
MALTRAQLLAGNKNQGKVLTGQVQAVTAGSGVSISATGVLSINADDPTFNGFVKTNNPLAFNQYRWPNADGGAGKQLTTNGSGILTWEDADSIPWTEKGQLVVGTGFGTQTLLDVGTDTSFLVANSATASGLEWTSDATAAALLPSGTTLDRPASPAEGQLRYNSDNNEFEGYGGTTPSWNYLSSMPTGPYTSTGTVEKIFYQNAIAIDEDYTTPVTANSMSAGPITIATGTTVTVPATSVWTIV